MKRNCKPISAAVIAIVAAMTLSGCIQLSDFLPGNGSGSSPEPGGNSTPSADPPAGTITDLSFEAGELLSDGARPELGDPFFTDDYWSLTSPDDGNGHWSYTGNDSLCTLGFTQQLLDSSLTVDGDDRATTDNYLAYVIGVTPEVIAIGAIDGAVTYGLTGSPERAQTRVISGAFDDGNHWVISARGFNHAAVGMHLQVVCAPGSDYVSISNDAFGRISIIAF